jgi:Na+:H+ antiporter, NhaA family
MTARLRKVPLTIFQRFFRTETLGGLVLLGFGLAALAIANSPLSEAYNHLWEIPLTVGIAPHELSLSFHEWINDGLMAVFFLLVGLEIKRELLAGELSSPRQAVLPLACAIGGMIVPALIYLIFNLRGVGLHGWGIPMATDIAFALGALNLIAPRAPIGAKVLLTALAIVDDMGSVLVISLFYSEAIVWSALGGCGNDFAGADCIQLNWYSASVAVPAGRSRPMVFCSCLRCPCYDCRSCSRVHDSCTLTNQRAGILERSTLAAG